MENMATVYCRAETYNALWHIVCPETTKPYCTRRIKIKMQSVDSSKFKKNPCSKCVSAYEQQMIPIALPLEEKRIFYDKITQSDLVICLQRCHQKYINPRLAFLNANYPKDFLYSLIQELSKLLNVALLEYEFISDINTELVAIEEKANLSSPVDIQNRILFLQQKKKELSGKKGTPYYKVIFLLEIYRWLQEGKGVPPDYYFFYPTHEREHLEAEFMPRYLDVCNVLDAYYSLGDVHRARFEDVILAHTKNRDGLVAISNSQQTPGESN